MEKDSAYVLCRPCYVDLPVMERVILIGSESGKLADLIEKYGDRVMQVHYYGDLSAVSRLRENFHGVLRVFPATKEEVVVHSMELKAKRVFVCPRFPLEKVEDVSFIASMGVAVDLLYRCIDMEPALLAELVDYYLYNTQLGVPVEPFHSILMSKMQQTKLTLWKLFMVNPGQFYYVDTRGIAGRCEDLNTDGYMYRIDSETNEIKKTPVKHPVKLFLDALPKDHPECMSCDHFNFCFGYGQYKGDNCDKWQTVLGKLQVGVKELKQGLRASKQKKK